MRQLRHREAQELPGAHSYRAGEPDASPGHRVLEPTLSGEPVLGWGVNYTTLSSKLSPAFLALKVTAASAYLSAYMYIIVN